MANQLFLNTMRLGVILLVIGSHPVESDVTVRASASQSHPMEGHSTALTCEVQSMNQSRQVIMWSKDQRSITWGDTMGQMMSSRFDLVMNTMNENLTSYTLNINDITRDDDGRYQCQVLEVNGNGYSAMASETVILSVLYFPASVYPNCSLNGSQTLLTGMELTVACTSEVGNPQISSVWTITDDTVAPLVYHTAESSSMMVSELDLTASQDLQGVTYICRVTSPAYPEFDRTCSLGPLRILDWPIVTITRSVQRVSEGADIHFFCHTEPKMPNLKWVTKPNIDPDRLVTTDGGSILKVKNVRRGDNATDVVCQVPYRDTQVEARSVILLDESTINPAWISPAPSFHATSDLCVPWFGAFLFTVAVSFILCIIIVRLLVKVRTLSSKSRADASRKDSLRKDNVLTWPAGLSNWSTRSDNNQQWDQRRKPCQSEDENDPAKREMRTYTELSPDTMERAKTRKKPRKAASLPMLGSMDSDSYVTPNTKSSNNPKKGNINTISGKVSRAAQSTAVEIESYMDLKDTSAPLPQKPTYQTLQRTPNSSKYTSKPAVSFLKKKRVPVKESSTADKDEMTGDSDIYGESGLYMKYEDGHMASAESNSSALTKKQESMMVESASYMPAGTVQRRRTSASIKQHRSGPPSSESSVDAYDIPYESPPETPVYGMGGEAIYAKSLGSKGGGKCPTRGKTRGTVSSRAPMPNPIAGDRKKLDPPSTDESYNEPYLNKRGDNREYFTLEPDQGSCNYGADISSGNESFQGADSWDPSNKTASQKSAPPARQTSSDTSYLELGDVEGEIKGYMDMTKIKSNQHKAPSKVTKQVILTDSEGSSTEYYQPMEGTSRNYEYSAPPSNKLRSAAEEPGNSGTSTCIAKGKTPLSMERKQNKRGGWGLFKK